MQDSDQAAEDWQAALLAALSDAIDHLQVLIFDEGWDRLLAATGSHEAALRESVATYERELARLFGIIRTSGALPGAVAWSALKADLRRAALDAETEISLRTALETGLYAAEAIPLGDHATYLRWSAALRSFLTARLDTRPARPAPDAPVEDRLLWAYQGLADIEEHAAFHGAFVAWIETFAPDRDAVKDVIDHQQRLLTLPRFDLFLNTGLRWLAESSLR